jgi:hypothetical protein
LNFFNATAAISLVRTVANPFPFSFRILPQLKWGA